jgi:folate-binding protein YgfZ
MAEEYRSMEERTGWAPRTMFGRLRFEGADVLTFLQALVTNDVARLVEGDGAYAAYLTPNGRMIADLELHCRRDSVTVEVPPGTSAGLAERLDSLIFSEDVRVSDVSTTTVELAVIGPRAADLVSVATGLDSAALAALVEPNHLTWSRGFVSAAGEARLPMFKVFLDAPSAVEITDAFARADATPLSPLLVEALRIEAGRARFGVDLGDGTIPLEAGLLERGISTAKGCYVGQEIIIRMLHRGGGRVAKRYVTFALPWASDAPASGAVLGVDGREVGRLTSVAPATTGAGWVAIGHVRTEHAEPGGTVEVTPNGAIATITGFTS